MINLDRKLHWILGDSRNGLYNQYYGYTDEEVVERAAELDLDTVVDKSSELYVEIGPNISPHIVDRKFLDGRTYLGIEGGSHDNPDSDMWAITSLIAATIVLRNRQNVVTSRRIDESIYFMLRDGKATGLPGRTATEVFMGNVISNGMDNHEVGGLLSEARRILSPAGKLVLHETITPYPLTDVESLLSASGFVVDSLDYMLGVSSDDQAYKCTASVA